jgi:hypothetical protein
MVKHVIDKLFFNICGVILFLLSNIFEYITDKDYKVSTKKSIKCLQLYHSYIQLFLPGMQFQKFLARLKRNRSLVFIATYATSADHH